MTFNNFRKLKGFITPENVEVVKCEDDEITRNNCRYCKNFAICKIADEHSALRKKIDEVALASGVKSDSKFGIMLSCEYFVYQFSFASAKPQHGYFL